MHILSPPWSGRLNLAAPICTTIPVGACSVGVRSGFLNPQYGVNPFLPSAGQVYPVTGTEAKRSGEQDAQGWNMQGESS